MPNLNNILILPERIIVEDFDEAVVLLDIATQAIYQLRELDGWIVRQIVKNSSRISLQNIVLEYSLFAQCDQATALDLIVKHCDDLAQSGILLVCCTKQENEEVLMLYFRNPDVNLREETDDGALLFNPDTNQLIMLNPTGLYIWKHLAQESSVDDIVTALQDEFEGATETELSQDVDEFLNAMISNSFVGTLE